MLAPLLPAVVVVLTSVSAAIAALFIFSAITLPIQRKANLKNLPAPANQAVFLFDDKELVDATRSARGLLDAVPVPGSDWVRLSAFLAPQFAGAEALLSRLAENGEFELRGGKDGNLRLQVEHIGRLARLTLVDLSNEGQSMWVDGLSHLAQEKELTTLREAMAAAPILIWRANDAGEVTWANRAYVDCAAEVKDSDEDSMTWPLPALFHGVSTAPKSGSSRRVRLDRPEGAPAMWYEWHSHPSVDGPLFFALPADAIVRAELALREFIQTLTKTFAHLPIGLAIFDRNRQLALFNPALVDLTSLGVDFLSARPTLFAFLDRLREAQVIPEPKNYHSWREEMAALEKAAASGFFEDTWSLPAGQTYKVTGRPHPDGAVAFQIEDISAETTLGRHFRSEIERGQEVVDTLAESIAVFSPAGELILSNTAYSELWGLDPKTTLGTVTITDSTRHWQRMTRPTPVWGELRDFVADMEERADWTADVTLTDGITLTCRVVPISGGATLVGFAGPTPVTSASKRPAQLEQPELHAEA